MYLSSCAVPQHAVRKQLAKAKRGEGVWAADLRALVTAVSEIEMEIVAAAKAHAFALETSEAQREEAQQAHTDEARNLREEMSTLRVRVGQLEQQVGYLGKEHAAAQTETQLAWEQKHATEEAMALQEEEHWRELAEKEQRANALTLQKAEGIRQVRRQSVDSSHALQIQLAGVLASEKAMRSALEMEIARDDDEIEGCLSQLERSEAR